MEPSIFERMAQLSEKIEIEASGLKVLADELEKISNSLERITNTIKENNEDSAA